jgi:hypothetical protein
MRAGVVWQGSAGNGVLEEVCKQFMVLARVSHELIATELIAWMGPCIGPHRHLKLGADVRDAFVGPNPAAVQCFQPVARASGLVDLPGLARQRLNAMGITRMFGNDGTAPWCTAGNPSTVLFAPPGPRQWPAGRLHLARVKTCNSAASRARMARFLAGAPMKYRINANRNHTHKHKGDDCAQYRAVATWSLRQRSSGRQHTARRWG